MKLPNGYGSVYKLSGNRRRPWIVIVTLEWDEETGKQVRDPIGYYETRAQALSALAEYNKNPIGKEREKTLGELYVEWSTPHYKDLKKATVSGYEAAWNRLGKLANYEVRAIKKSHLQDIVEEMKDQELSRSTMEKFKTLAGLLWDEAMADQIVNVNLGKLIKLPPARKTKKPTFADLEIKEIEVAAETGDIWAGTIMILLYTGMRVGELLKLTRFSLDLENWVVTGGIKTDAGKDRPMPIHHKIRKHITYWVDNPGPRLIHRKGGPISVDYYRKHIFYPTLERLEIDYKARGLTPHSTRHTFASTLDRVGAKTTAIQNLMGHSDYTTTANIYTHQDLDELWEAINLIS